MSEVDLTKLAPLLDARVPRVDPETGAATTEAMDWEQSIFGFIKRTVVNLGQKLTTVSSQTDQNTASITDEINARTDGDNAEADARRTLAAVVGENSATADSYNLAAVNRDNALSERIDINTTTLNGHTAEIQQLQESVDGNEVRWQVQGTIDSQSGGVYFSGVKDKTNGVTYDFTFVANSFRLYDPGLNGGAPTSVFNYSGGIFTFNVPVRIGTLDIGQQSVNQAYIAQPNSNASWAADGGTWRDVLTLTVTGGDGYYARVDAIASLGRTAGSSGNISFFGLRLYSDTFGDLTGNQYANNGIVPNDGAIVDGQTGYIGNTLVAILSSLTGTDTIRLQVRNTRSTGSGFVLWASIFSRLVVEMRKR